MAPVQTLFVLESDRSVSAALEALAGAHGYRFVAFSSLAAALAAPSPRACDLVFSDLHGIADAKALSAWATAEAAAGLILAPARKPRAGFALEGVIVLDRPIDARSIGAELAARSATYG